MAQLLTWLVLVSLLVVGCAKTLSEEIVVEGTIELSDHPATGNAGVNVTNGYLTTETNRDGYFRLEGKILMDAKFTITATKDGYSGYEWTIGLDHRVGQDPVGPGGVESKTITLAKVVLTKY